MYEYVIAVGILIIIWLFLYFKRGDLKSAMWFSSWLCAPLGISDYFFIPDYWTPHTLFNLVPGIESFIFAFCIGGVSSALYKTLMDKRIVKLKKKSDKQGIILFTALFTTMLLMNFIFRVDLIYDGHVTMLLGAIIIMLMRRDLIEESIIGGLFFLLLYFPLLVLMEYVLFPGAVERIWTLNNPIFHTFLGLPFEEIIWSLTFGMLWSPIYELIKGYKIKA